MKMEVLFERYERYECGNMRKLTVTGDDKLDCLKKMVDNMGLYIDSEDVCGCVDEGEGFDDILEHITSSNGDGCDFIFYIKDLTENKVIFEEGYEEREV